MENKSKLWKALLGWGLCSTSSLQMPTGWLQAEWKLSISASVLHVSLPLSPFFLQASRIPIIIEQIYKQLETRVKTTSKAIAIFFINHTSAWPVLRLQFDGYTWALLSPLLTFFCISWDLCRTLKDSTEDTWFPCIPIWYCIDFCLSPLLPLVSEMSHWSWFVLTL